MTLASLCEFDCLRNDLTKTFGHKIVSFRKNTVLTCLSIDKEFLCYVFILISLALSPSYAVEVGFANITVRAAVSGSPNMQALSGAIWYPAFSRSGLAPQDGSNGNVVVDGEIAGGQLPLVIMSHGVFGRWSSNTETALALAHAGFIVAAVSHDDFGSGTALHTRTRSPQLVALLDTVLQDWPGRLHIDPGRIGAYGFSFGGFAALVLAGGKPDASRVAPHCQLAPQEWSCTLLAQGKLDLTDGSADWVHDRRIKALVLAAPALGYIFASRGCRE